MGNLISIVIPSAKDPHLQKTISSLRDNAKYPVEIIVVLDGTPQDVYGVNKVVLNQPRIGMRGSINKGVKKASGDYIMKTDAHCMFSPNYDKYLLSVIKDNWVVIPRRYKLDVEKWTIINEPPIDYELIKVESGKLHGVIWGKRSEERKDLLIDENMTFQGSCWFMSRKHWDWLGGLQEEGYGTFTQEPMEIALKTWLGGGKVMVNKKTWYAHKHRKFGRTVRISGDEVRKGNAYSKDFWINNRWDKRVHDFEWLMEHFR